MKIDGTSYNPNSKSRQTIKFYQIESSGNDFTITYKLNAYPIESFDYTMRDTIYPTDKESIMVDLSFKYNNKTFTGKATLGADKVHVYRYEQNHIYEFCNVAFNLKSGNLTKNVVVSHRVEF
jgi:hypothetical protein